MTTPGFGAHRCALLSALVLLILPMSIFAQGSLTPPGPPAATMKSLDQIASTGIAINATNTPRDGANVFVISQPGSYYLTGNLSGGGSKNGILVSSDNVTIELNGFTLTGPGSSLTGIECGTQKNVVIRNGTLRSWFTGISTTGGGSRIRVENVRAVSNASGGFSVGANSLISNCLVDGNTTVGIGAQANATIQNCVVIGSATGISAGSNAFVAACLVTGNGQGMSVGNGSIVSGCEIVSNTASGILANANCVVKDCTIANNAAKGIDTVTAGGSAAGTIIQNCLFSGNTGVAIDLSGSCIVRDCMIAPSSSADGITMSTVNSSWIYNNHIRGAIGHSGLNSNGNNNRIESNSFTSNATAITFGASSNSNVVIRNVFLLNTADIINNGAAQKNAQIGTFGAGQVSTDPWQNIK